MQSNHVETSQQPSSGPPEFELVTRALTESLSGRGECLNRWIDKPLELISEARQSAVGKQRSQLDTVAEGIESARALIEHLKQVKRP